MVRRLSHFDTYQALVIDFSDVPSVDFTSSLAIDDIISDARQAGQKIYLARIRVKVRAFLERQGFWTN